MKKIISLAVVALAVAGCDPYNSEPSNGGITEVMVISRTGNPVIGTSTGTDTWEVTGVTATTAATTNGKLLVIKTDTLLKGELVEAEPNTCIPAAGLNLTVTEDSATATSDICTVGGVRPCWFACYNPGTPTSLEGASIFIYFSSLDPSPILNNAPNRAGRFYAGNYTFTGDLTTHGGTVLPFTVDVTVN